MRRLVRARKMGPREIPAQSADLFIRRPALCCLLCGLTAHCLFHAPRHTEQEDVDAADVSRVPADVLRNVEADTYWCMSKLLDGIQVSPSRC